MMSDGGEIILSSVVRDDSVNNWRNMQHMVCACRKLQNTQRSPTTHFVRTSLPQSCKSDYYGRFTPGYITLGAIPSLSDCV